MLPRNHPDRIRIVFDDRRLVANAGLILPATLSLRLGLPELVQQLLDLGNAPGRANTGDANIAGATSVDRLFLFLLLLLLLQGQRPLEHREGGGLGLAVAALGLHRFLGHELRPGEQRLLRLRGLLVVAVA